MIGPACRMGKGGTHVARGRGDRPALDRHELGVSVARVAECKLVEHPPTKIDIAAIDPDDVIATDVLDIIAKSWVVAFPKHVSVKNLAERCSEGSKKIQLSQGHRKCSEKILSPN